VYQHAWISLARRGVMVLAYDPPGQGERLEYYDAASGTSRIGIGTREHTHAGQQCLLTGTSIARYMAWDGIRAIDYLLTRHDVDPARLGVAGNSGGGTQAAWLGVVEPRLSALDVSCYITSWRALWGGPGPQDMEQVLPGLLSRGLDFSDLIVAAAPRPYLVSSATRDYFPIEGARATVASARTAYAALGAGDRLGTAEHDDTHGWKQPLREAAYRWFARWWRDAGVSGDSDEGEVRVEPAEALRASPTGQVATSFRSRTIFDLNRDRAQRLDGTRAAATPARLRALLQVPDAPAATSAHREADAPVDGLRAERLELVGEGGLGLPARLIHPPGPPRGVVLVADGRARPATEPVARRMEKAARRWARHGYLTLVLDVRGAGVAAPVRGEGGYAADYQTAARAWLLGTSVVAWQTRDLLAGLAWLDREQPGSGLERVLHVAGLTAPAGLFAAALRPVSAAWVEDGLASYLDLATTRDYQAPAGVFVPGVLEVTDLPEAMAMARPGIVHLVRPVGADGRVLEDEAALRRRLGAAIPDNVRFTPDPPR
jgi:dienelactone hydrolase